ncbi:MAG TPA: IS5 family transposase [Thermogutta sp.]|nr:IS5 family transposase [Thermogutta sp.]HQF15419.1 IS5 family transposase [Thermogutta sp.]
MITDEQWEKIAGSFDPPAKAGQSRRDRRVIVEAILWILRTGTAWRDLPSEFGPWQTAYRYFRTWSKSGLWQRIFYALRALGIEAGEVGVEAWHVDGTVVRASRAAAGGGEKGPRGACRPCVRPVARRVLHQGAHRV